MSWIYLIFAGLFEMGWPLGLKLAQTSSYKLVWFVTAAVAMGISGYFLYMAQKSIPIGTAYAVWTGIGATGTFIIGIMFFHDSANIWRILSVFLLISGIIGLKLTS